MPAVSVSAVRNEIEVDRGVRGLLSVTARDVVKEAVARRPDVRVVRGHRCGYEHAPGVLNLTGVPFGRSVDPFRV